MRNLPTKDLSQWFSNWMDVDRTFDRWLEGVAPSRSLAKEWAGFNPACDIEETDDLYSFSFDIPGMKESDIKVELHDNRLFVSGERSDAFKDEKGARRVVECNYGRFERVFTLPNSVNENAIEATYENGVLKVMVPKAKEAKKKTIAIKPGGPSH